MGPTSMAPTWLCVLAAALARASAASALTADEHLAAQVDWILSKGGYFSSKIQYRQEDPSDPSSPRSMFLWQPADEGEVLMVVPKECLFTSGTEREEMCDTVRRLADEYERGEKGTHWPYVRYVMDPRHDGDLPSAWSDGGKHLIWSIVGEELFNGENEYDWDVVDYNYVDACGGGQSQGTELQRKAFRSVLRRSWDDVLVPVYDMIDHRNGHYKNVDSNSAHGGNDVRVVALRDVAAGERLHLSYNECTDCHDYAHDLYAVHYLLRDYGFVEEYPRRWRMLGGDLHFQLEEADEGATSSSDEGVAGAGARRRLKVVWLDPNGPSRGNDWAELRPQVYGHLKRVKELPVEEMAEEMELPPHEARTSLKFHEALIEALDHAIRFLEDKQKDVAKVGGIPSLPVTYGVGDAPLRPYDDLSDHDDEMDEEENYDVTFNYDICLGDPAHNTHEPEPFSSFQSFYQPVDFYRSTEDDVCMRLDDHLESCQSNRAHYHEVLVHYAASYAKDVKRVMFLGGGDNMILHELLKYDSLELVVGLELDKGVCEASFVDFETLPRFEDDRVEWWFGDCIQSLKLLPPSYLGSFDLVYVDLQTAIIKALGVMEAVRPYAHPTRGILIRNEDRGWGTPDPFAVHNVDIYAGDVPLFCNQGYMMGSDAVDFFTAPRFMHETDNLYYDEATSLEGSGRFDLWYNYRRADEFAATKASKATPAAAGALLVLELEDLSEEVAEERVSGALKKAGLSLGKTKASTAEGRLASIFLAEEGYVLARSFPDERYAAIDVVLWSDHEKTYDVERELRAALKSGASSSYRIVTCGVRGVAADGKKGDDFWSAADPGACEDEDAAVPAVDPAFALPVGPAHINAASKTSLSTLLSGRSSPGILVLCGEASRPCDALDVARALSSAGSNPTVAYAPPASESVFAHESAMRDALRAFVASGRKVDAIVVDVGAPKVSGQVLRKILDRAELRGRALSDAVAVVAATTDRKGSSWTRALLDRFRAGFFPYNPSFHAEVVFRPPEDGGAGSEGGGELGLSVYSAGNPDFYADLVRAADEIAKIAGLKSDVRYVRNGMNNYEADFSPSAVFSHAAYDHAAARKQRESQRPTGRQSVMQFDAKAPGASYAEGKIESYLRKVLSSMNVKEAEVDVVRSKVGEGGVVCALWKGGDAVVVYDGDKRLDLNLFTLDMDEEFHGYFEGHFVANAPSVALKLRDTQPRGPGGVVAFLD